ncbi:MAG: MFS transporter [Proteobacteria bacterium]|nr:MFS transporter [Pseudomonadota bacterium]
MLSAFPPAKKPAHVSFAALRHPGFRPYLIFSAMAMMADSIEHVISYWVVFQKFQSPSLGGFAVLSHWLPYLFFSVYSGALADRFDPRRLIQIGMGCFIAASLAWAYFFYTDTLEIWHAQVILVLHGCAGVLWSPASQLLIHDIVGKEQLPSAVRLNATARYLGLLLGPGIGGGILLLMGPVAGIAFNALIYLPLVIWLWKAPYGPRFRKTADAPHPALRGLGDIVDTARVVGANPILLAMTLLIGCASFLVGNAYHAQMPEFARDLGHGDVGFLYSMLLAADAAGALLAGIALESTGTLQPRPRLAFGLAMVWCIALVAFAVTPFYALAFVALFIAGFVELSFSSMAMTLVQLNAPDHVRGRVIGFYSICSLGMRAFAGATVGLGGTVVGIHWSLALSAGVLFIVMTGLTLYVPRAAPLKAP